MNPFDFVKSINTTKKNLIQEDPNLESDYNPYLTNKSLSYHRDSIFFADKMNELGSNLTKKMQYEFYLYGLSKNNRFFKSDKIKEKDDEIVDLLMIEYNVSRKQASEYRDLLNKNQINIIKDKYFKGGR